VRLRSLLAVTALACGAASLLLAVATVPFTRFIADDFGISVLYRRQGFWGAQWTMYETLFGRFSATAAAVMAAVLGEPLALLFPLLAIVTLVTSAIALLGIVTRETTGARLAGIAAALALAAAIVDAAPDRFQSFYWLAGLFSYGTAAAAILALIALVARASTRDSKWLVATAAVLTFIAGGFCEPAAVSLVAASIVVAVMSRGPLRRIAAVCAVAALAALVVVALAPGNAVRVGLLHPMPLPEAIVTTAKATLPTLLAMTRRALPWLLIMAAAVFVMPRPRHGLSGRAAVTACVVAIGTTAAILLTGFVTMSSPPPPRTMLVVLTWSVLSWTALLLWVRSYVPETTTTLLCIAVLLVTGIVTGPATSLGRRYAELQSMRAFASEMDGVAKLARARTGQDLALPGPRSYERLQIMTRDPADPVNRVLADYYGLAAVRWDPPRQPRRTPSN
jgi:hypothetical protein